jgi:hypothetical protein
VIQRQDEEEEGGMYICIWSGDPGSSNVTPGASVGIAGFRFGWKRFLGSSCRERHDTLHTSFDGTLKRQKRVFDDA